MSRKIIEFYGWYGVITIIGAYTLNSFSILMSDSIAYQILNLTGGFGILLSSWIKKNYQPVAVNIVWVLVAFIALLKVFLKF